MGGYQGPSSVLSQALEHVVNELRAAVLTSLSSIEFQLTLDVTAQGMTAQSLFDSVEDGERKICYLASSYLSARASDLRVLDIPFCVSDRAAALVQLDGKVGDLLAQNVERNTKLKILAFWDNGFRHISNKSRPLYGPTDCNGLKIRTLNSQIYCDVLRAIGFVPVVSDVRELNNVVSTGQVEAQENPLTNFINFELWHHHRYLSLTQHFFGVALLVCNRPWFEALNNNDQNAVRSAALSATQLQRRLAASEDSQALSFLREQSVSIVSSDELDIKAMVSACAGISENISKHLPTELVDLYLQSHG